MVKSQLTFALIQSDLAWENKEVNLNRFEEKINSIDFACDIVILPEMFSTGFTMNAGALGEGMDGTTMKWLRLMSEKSGKVITGSFICEEEGRHYNRLIWMKPDGTFQKYDKKHLFRMAGEDNYYASGDSNILVEFEGWKIRPLICYDLRFPVWSRNKHEIKDGLAIPEYDLVYFVANWPAVRSLPWDILLRARAVENQVYCLGVNRVGKDGNDKEYNGHSAAINPKGEYILDPVDSVEGIFEVSVDYESLQLFRRKFPQGLDADSFELT